MTEDPRGHGGTVDVPSEHLVAVKARLDGIAARAEVDGEFEPDERALLEATAERFLAAGPEILVPVAEHLWAYYHDVVALFRSERRREHGIPDLDPSVDIWDEVEVRHPPHLGLGGSRLAPDLAYLSFEGEVSWEPEHGLQLVFAEGVRVCKVGPYDGHHTHAHAAADLDLLGVVYRRFSS